TKSDLSQIEVKLTLRLFSRLRGGFAVHRLGDTVRTRLELAQRIADRDRVARATDQVAQIRDVSTHLLDDRLVHELRALLGRTLTRVQQRLGVVAQLGKLFALRVALPELLRLIDDLRDLVLRETARRHDLDRLLTAGADVFRRHVQDTLGIDVEVDFD